MSKAAGGVIRQARVEEVDLLSQLSLASKRYWNYPEAFYTVWRSELTITEEYLSHSEVFVYEHDKLIDGYYSLVTLTEPLQTAGIVLPEGTWLEHMFVRPDCIGRGIGRLLFYHLQQNCYVKGIRLVQILADPHARGFYEKMGCTYLREFPSSIAGRTTPWLQLACDSADSVSVGGRPGA